MPSLKAKPVALATRYQSASEGGSHNHCECNNHDCGKYIQKVLIDAYVIVQIFSKT